MNTNKLIIFIVVLCLGCSSNKRDKLETFIWIENNRNWISNDSTKLIAFSVIKYNDDNKVATYAKRTPNNGYEFYSIQVSNSLHELIYNNLYNKDYREYYKHDFNLNPYLWWGNVYCLIFKFSNQPARMINYIPLALPDSLTSLIKYIEELPHKGTRQVGTPFDVTGIVKRYRQKMFLYYDIILPVPDSLADKYKYVPPINTDTNRSKSTDTIK